MRCVRSRFAPSVVFGLTIGWLLLVTLLPLWRRLIIISALTVILRLAVLLIMPVPVAGIIFLLLIISMLSPTITIITPRLIVLRRCHTVLLRSRITTAIIHSGFRRITLRSAI